MVDEEKQPPALGQFSLLTVLMLISFIGISLGFFLLTRNQRSLELVLIGILGCDVSVGVVIGLLAKHPFLGAITGFVFFFAGLCFGFSIPAMTWDAGG